MEMNINWNERYCSFGEFNFKWSVPRLDNSKRRYRSILHVCTSTHGDLPEGRFQKEISIKESEYSAEKFQSRIVREVLQAVQELKNKKDKPPSLCDYLFSDAKWEEIRKYFAWSTTTASTYKSTLKNVFGTVLLLPMDKVRTEDIENAINRKCSHCTYKASTIRSWLKIINRIFVYLEATCPEIRNPVRMNGKKIREAYRDQKKATAEGRITQKALTDEQSRTMLQAFLADIKHGENLGVCGIIILENGRRPCEAGATTLGMHMALAGENFLAAPVYEVNNGKIINKHKSAHSRRLIPDSPVLEQVYTYYCQQVIKKLSESDCNDIDWRTIPFGGKFTYDRHGRLKNILPYSSKAISAYVREKLEECGISFSVVVDDSDEDSDDNRRAYSLRYTALSNLFYFLPRDKYQYIAAHRRSASETGREDNHNRQNYYRAPQVQREIYEAMKKADEAVYGETIVNEIRHFLELDV